ncbi:Lcl C-terminal domain-containing protein [Candidatus Marithrix sp. Canyon 246]|uniref:Lcl C-terminal domain-containing protein n=1 Tax=Candidatus Marithrix sp. Canyon 246 TaxID=1827136 RepID=UPI00084A0A58|nr:DUF1566 domain-containing protein [Candidatus Marithrix sp. Canyon 246]
MKIKIAIMCSTVVFSSPLLAGSLDSPAAPDHDDSAMYTIEDIYNRLDNGATGTKRTGAFVEPTNGPTAGTGHTLDEVMSKTPVITGNGATAVEVLSGKFYWGLLGGSWGLQQGTATAGVDVTGSSLSMTIPDGFYSGGKTATANDSNLTAANIKNSVTIFGVSGSVVEATGDATAGEVLTGNTFSNSGNAGVSGSMDDNAAVTMTPSTTEQTIAVGYHNGSGTVAGDTDLTAANIKSGVDIFGVSGSVVEATGDAAAGDVLTGLTFSNSSGAGISGSMADKDGDNASTAQSATAGVNKLTAPTGFYDGDDTVTATDAEIVALDSDLTAENIKKDVAIFGVTGTYEAGATCSGTLNGTRWCDNANGTITDMTTGLIWLKKADWGGQKQWDGNSNDNAHVRAGILKAGESGADLTDGSVEGDWRLPTKTELVGITTGDEKVLYSSMRAFSGVHEDDYWSSSTYVNDAAFAWYAALHEEHDDTAGYADKVSTPYVWPVRDGM